MVVVGATVTVVTMVVDGTQIDAVFPNAKRQPVPCGETGGHGNCQNEYAYLHHNL